MPAYYRTIRRPGRRPRPSPATASGIKRIAFVRSPGRTPQAWTLTVAIEVCQGLHTVIRSFGGVEQSFPTEAEAVRFGFAYGKQRIDAGAVWEELPAAPACAAVPPPSAA
jgi:hypothetical protein